MKKIISFGVLIYTLLSQFFWSITIAEFYTNQVLLQPNGVPRDTIFPMLGLWIQLGAMIWFLESDKQKRFFLRIGGFFIGAILGTIPIPLTTPSSSL